MLFSKGDIMWKSIQINKNQIKIKTARAVLINCPAKSKYSGYAFWHPTKCVRSGKHNAAVSIGYTDEFKFKLIKYGKGKYNSRNVIDEALCSVAEIEGMFESTNDNITASNIDTESYLVVSEPAFINVQEVGIPACLTNN